MASGGRRSYYGSLVGTGNALSVTTVGFRPREVQLFNATAAANGTWVEGMADGAASLSVTAGTNSFITSGGVTPLANGFSLGNNADLNTAAETVHFICRD